MLFEWRRTAAGDAPRDATADTAWPPRCGVHASRGAQAEGLRLEENGSGTVAGWDTRSSTASLQGIAQTCGRRLALRQWGACAYRMYRPQLLGCFHSLLGGGQERGPGANISNSPLKPRQRTRLAIAVHGYKNTTGCMTTAVLSLMIHRSIARGPVSVPR